MVYLLAAGVALPSRAAPSMAAYHRGLRELVQGGPSAWSFQALTQNVNRQSRTNNETYSQLDSVFRPSLSCNFGKCYSFSARESPERGMMLCSRLLVVTDI